MKVAVVGAGIAGLACAKRLTELGVLVEVFDKARGPGGRMTSKRTTHGYLDLGAQYFSGRVENAWLSGIDIAEQLTYG